MSKLLLPSRKTFQKFLKILRERCCHFQIAAVRRMNQSEYHGMQSLSFQMIRIFLRTIDRISKKRMMQRRHVYTNLMCPSGFQLAFNISVIGKTFQYPVMSHRMFSVLFIDGHFFSLCRMTSNGGIYRSLIFFDHTIYNGPIFPGDGVLIILWLNN